MKKTINLNDYLKNDVKALVGRNNGELLLKQFTKNGIILKNLENEYDEIEILFPDSIVTINKSYFLGWLETRVIELKRHAFISKYKFLCSEHIKNRIMEYIDAALLEASPEDILNG